MKTLKSSIKNIPFLYDFIMFFIILKSNIVRRLTEGGRRRDYYEQIERIKKRGIIVVDLAFGGIGDCLAWSTLPRLLSEKYGVEFYLSERSLETIRLKDTYKLVFEMNPYFKGVRASDHAFRLCYFEREKSIYTFITDKGGENIIETLERQFGVSDRGRPELYYAPRLLPDYQHIVLVDENTVSGKRFGWKFKDGAFMREAQKHATAGDHIVRVDTKKQDLFTYVDMIYSCRYFVATFSGGASIAACFDKPFSVIWPLHGKNRSNYQFRYAGSRGVYTS